MQRSHGSGGFTTRDEKTQRLIRALKQTILTKDRYFILETGIEHRFGEHAELVHSLLYNSLGPTTDLLRYFPDSLCFDRTRRLPTWQDESKPEILQPPAGRDTTGLFTFFVEYKFSATERKKIIGDVPTCYIGQIEREAWLTYRRLTSGNPKLGAYLDGRRTRIALFYAATYAPEKLYAGWEQNLTPILVRKDVAEPGKRAVDTRGSGTPWINFDIRQMKPLQQFLTEDLLWQVTEAETAVGRCLRFAFED